MKEYTEREEATIDVFLASKFMTLEPMCPELSLQLQTFRERVRNRRLNPDPDPGTMQPEVQYFVRQLRASLRCSEQSGCP
jgi:hypothetical protein